MFPPRSPAIATTVGLVDGGMVVTGPERLACHASADRQSNGVGSCVLVGGASGVAQELAVNTVRKVATRTRGNLSILTLGPPNTL